MVSNTEIEVAKKAGRPKAVKKTIVAKDSAVAIDFEKETIASVAPITHTVNNNDIVKAEIKNLKKSIKTLEGFLVNK
tara:strand:- start:8599 stop:8829 length:231 start_codon:yes stop_codon:yes gene_type:complete